MESSATGSDSGRSPLHDVIAEYLRREGGPDPLDRQTLLEQYPQLADELRAFFDSHDKLNRLAEPVRPPNPTEDADEATLAPATTAAGVKLTLSAVTPVAVQAAESPFGTFGDYDLVEEIARGGMGIVYKARHSKLDRVVALKMILAGQLASAEDIRRFQAEAEAAAQLDHPGIVPIYEVGQHDGRHYFTMRFVEGVSLSTKLADGPLPPRETAALVAKIARAVQFAHDQSVIHRDLKPANILIDTSSEPHVTDFGLAKRTERDSELTGTGQVLGTPGYMPPEQAAGNKDEVGPSSDVYSLGAILYELLTGRPPFRAATPLDTLMQVLENDPAAPRMLNPVVPLDLEIICLKCLEKLPARRYASAAELAEDLTRFLEGESIRARAPNPVEILLRWTRRQQRSVILAISAALFALTLALVTIGGWIRYQYWIQGHLTLHSTDGQAIRAEVLDRNGQLALPRFTVPTQQPLEIPAGSWQVRLAPGNKISQTYQLLVQRGQFHEYEINLQTQRRREPVRFPSSLATAKIDGPTDLILPDLSSIQRIDGSSGSEIWSIPIPAAIQSLWQWPDEASRSGRGHFDLTPDLVPTQPDLDQDGTGDLVWALRRRAALVAMSGKDGTLIWSYPPVHSEPLRLGTVLGTPKLIDADNDGSRDLLTTFAEQDTTGARCWMTAISGRDGKVLWRYDFDPRWLAAPTRTAVPSAGRWYPNPNLTTTNHLGFGAGYSKGESYKGWRYDLIGQWHQVPYAATKVSLGETTLAICLAGTKLVGVDLRTGQQRWQPRELGVNALRPPQFRDLNNDGEVDLLLMRRAPAAGVKPNTDILAFSLNDGNQLWQAKLQAEWGLNANWFDSLPDWPLVEDLDGDNRRELVATTSYASTTGWSVSGRAALVVLDAESGKRRWISAPIKSLHQQIDRIAIGPDIDRDGFKDIFSASLCSMESEKLTIFADARSGRNGELLWVWSEQTDDSYSDCRGLGIEPIRWWNTGKADCPKLLIGYTPDPGSRSASIYVISAFSGRLEHVVADLANPLVGDFDDDGVSDLSAISLQNPTRFDGGGSLEFLWSSSTREVWQRLGGKWKVACDLDGDGWQDLLQAGRKLTAISGRDGKLICEVGGYSGNAACDPAPDGDLDRDGTADILVDVGGRYFTMSGSGLTPVQAVSASKGRLIWSGDLRILGYGATQFLGARDLDHDGRSEVVFLATLQWLTQTKQLQKGWQWGVVVMDGRSGAVKWKHQLTNFGRQWDGRFHAERPLEPALADLNDDGHDDLVLPAMRSRTEYELRALSGLDGTVLWQRTVAITSRIDQTNQSQATLFQPRITDLEGDGQPEVLIVHYPASDASLPEHPVDADSELLALHGVNGELKWRWSWKDQRLQENSHLAITPLLIDRSNKQEGVALIVHPESSSRELVCLSAEGDVLQRISFEGHPEKNVAVGDLDGNGTREFALLNGTELTAFGNDLKPTWRWQLPGEDSGATVQLLSRQKRTTVVVRSGPAAYAVDGLSGTLTWQYHGRETELELLQAANPTDLPRVVDSNQQRTICRRVLAEAEQTGEPTPSDRRAVASATDPRLARQLPWAHTKHEAAFEFALSALLATVIFVIPGVAIYAGFRRGSWSLTQLMFLPVLFGLILGFFRLVDLESAVSFAGLRYMAGPLLYHHPTAVEVLRSPIDLLLFATQGLMVLSLPGLLIAALCRRRWRRFTGLCVFWLVVSAVMGSVTLLNDLSTLRTGEYYSLAGWGWILLFGEIIAGTLVAIAGLVLGTFRKIRTIFRPDSAAA